MANFGNQNFTGFRGVNLLGSTFIRVGGFDTYQGTVGILGGSLDGARAWNFPNKNGTFPISGTIGIDLPSVASGGYLSTLVTVTGITAEDGVVVVPQARDAVGVMSARGALLVANAVPGAGNITILLVNAFATATVASTQSVFAYTAVR